MEYLPTFTINYFKKINPHLTHVVIYSIHGGSFSLPLSFWKQIIIGGLVEHHNTFILDLLVRWLEKMQNIPEMVVKNGDLPW